MFDEERLYEANNTGIRWLDMTAAMLNKELDGFSTAKQRIKYLEELIRQAKEKSKDFAEKVVGYYNFISTNKNILNHDIWKQQHKKWELERYNNFFDDDNSPLSKPSDAFATLKVNYELNLGLAKRLVQDIKSEYGSITYWDENIDIILFLGREDDNSKSFEVIGERIDSQIKMLQNVLNHWRLYATIESETPMQTQPSTPEQALAATKVNWQGDAKDLVRVFVRWKELGRISHEDDEMLSLLCNSFTCKGKPLNRGTIKTYLSDIRRESHDSQRHIEKLL